MKFRQVIIESPSKCTLQCGGLIVQNAQKTTRVNLEEINAVILDSTAALISSALLGELTSRGIAVLICNDKHLAQATVLPYSGSFNMSVHYSEQTSWSEPRKKRLWQRVVEDKISMQAQSLSLKLQWKQLHSHKNEEENALLSKDISSKVEQLKRLSREVVSADSTAKEATAAHLYFPAFFGKEFTRQIDNHINSKLNYGYAIVMSKVAREIASRGYLTYVGIHHRSTVNNNNLSCDFMEPFRPCVDLWVDLNLCGEELDSLTKGKIVELFSQKVFYMDGMYRLDSVIQGYVEQCLRYLNRSCSIEEINLFDMSPLLEVIKKEK